MKPEVYAAALRHQLEAFKLIDKPLRALLPENLRAAFVEPPVIRVLKEHFAQPAAKYGRRSGDLWPVLLPTGTVIVDSRGSKLAGIYFLKGRQIPDAAQLPADWKKQASRPGEAAAKAKPAANTKKKTVKKKPAAAKRTTKTRASSTKTRPATAKRKSKTKPSPAKRKRR